NTGRRFTCGRISLQARGSTNLPFRIATKHSGNIVALLRRRHCERRSMCTSGSIAEALKEYNYLISLHPRLVTLARVLKQRAWLQSRCPGPAFRNSQQAVKDAKAACILGWKDENTIDTLAAAYAETGDFNSAVQYA